MLLVYLVSLPCTQVLSAESSKKLYTEQTKYVDVLKNQLGPFFKKTFQFCVFVQHLIFPIIYLMMITYQVNYLLYKGDDETSNNLVSLSVIAGPILLLFFFFFSNVMLKISWLNLFTFFMSALFIVFVSARNFIKTVESVTINDRDDLEIEFRVAGQDENSSDRILKCELASFSWDSLVSTHSLGYALSIWLILFNTMTYTSHCSYSKNINLRLGSVNTLMFVVCLLLFFCIVPMMICSNEFEKVGFFDFQGGMAHMMHVLTKECTAWLLILVSSIRLLTETACSVNYIQEMRLSVG